MAYLSAYVPTRRPGHHLPGDTPESSSKQGRPIAKASKLVMCFGGVASVGGLQEEVFFFFILSKSSLLWLFSPIANISFNGRREK